MANIRISPHEKGSPLPFLKWAGGKRWLISEYSDFFPNEYERYFEPFLGSAAVFFHLSPPKSFLSDACKELIDTYTAVRDDWEGVLRRLHAHQKKHSKDYYYEVRSSLPNEPSAKAARFIYLNRTCWNGLYRVNLKGQFNVPIGTKSSVLLGTDDFKSVSGKLEHAEILHCDFEKTIDKAQKNDFVFVDPPYTVKHNHNGFVKYNENIFSWDDQVRLRNAIDRATERGAKVMMTNACHTSIQELYEGMGEITFLPRKSVISGTNKGRGNTEEIVMRNWYV